MRLPVLAPYNRSDEQNALYATMRAEIKDHFHGFITEREDGALDDVNTDKGESVVQVHPGPPFQSPVNTRLFLLFPLSELSLTKPFCQPFVNFAIGRMALHSGR
jgi:hypothetical protein